eukprot:1980777-Rhodomonas_salina.2
MFPQSSRSLIEDCLPPWNSALGHVQCSSSAIFWQLRHDRRYVPPGRSSQLSAPPLFPNAALGHSLNLMLLRTFAPHGFVHLVQDSTSACAVARWCEETKTTIEAGESSLSFHIGTAGKQENTNLIIHRTA